MPVSLDKDKTVAIKADRDLLKRVVVALESGREGDVDTFLQRELSPVPHSMRRQCGPVVRALALRSGDPGFKARSDHSLNLILVVPASTSQLHL